MQNQKIMIIAPAESLKEKSENRLFAEVRVATELGFAVVYGKNIFVNEELGGSSIDKRIADLHDAYRDKDVKIIMCAKGGCNSNDLLEHIDWSLVKKNPKPIIGSSDITVLLNAIYAKTGCTTFFGPNFIDFSEKIGFEYTMQYIKKALLECDYSILPSKTWSDDMFFKDQLNRTFFSNEGPIIIQYGSAEGTIIGGNLCSLNLLQGTPYMPNLDGCILCIEDDNLAGESFLGEFNRNLRSLLQSKTAKNIKGILIGRNQLGLNMTTEKLKYIFLSKMLSSDIPIIANLDFGHTRPFATLPIGEHMRIVATENKCQVRVIKKEHLSRN